MLLTFFPSRPLLISEIDKDKYKIKMVEEKDESESKQILTGVLFLKGYPKRNVNKGKSCLELK